MDEHSLKGKKILFFQQRGWGKQIGRFLAKKLYDEGCRLAALTSKPTTHRAISGQSDVIYDLILSHDEILDDPKKYLAGENFSIDEICRELGVDSIWPLLSASRVLAKSYEKKYYYSFKKNVSDEFCTDYVKALWKCAKKIFTDFKPDIILAPNFASGHHILFYLYAKKLGVKMLTVTDSKVKGVFMFSESPYDDEGRYYEYLDALNRGELKSTAEERDLAKKYIGEFREKFIKPAYSYKEKKLSFLEALRIEISPWKRVFMWYLKRPANYIKGIGASIDWREPHIILRDHFADKKNKKEAQNFPYYPLEKVGKFVYFPLQFQPESSIDAVAPRFSNQIETARQVAMSLPGDYTLVVKDHPGMLGLRPSSYLGKIAGTPNVKLIDYRISSEEILKRADLIVGPNGTTFSEAAFYRKPVIQLGNLGTTLRLPNVFKHTDMTTLPGKIKEVMGKNLDTKDYEHKLENFIIAANHTGFHLDYSAMWQEGKKDKMDNLWEVYKREISLALSNNRL